MTDLEYLQQSECVQLILEGKFTPADLDSAFRNLRKRVRDLERVKTEQAIEIQELLKRIEYQNNCPLQKCECYTERIEFYYKNEYRVSQKIVGRCLGTKEQEECSCGGDKSKCNFYLKEKKNDISNIRSSSKS